MSIRIARLLAAVALTIGACSASVSPSLSPSPSPARPPSPSPAISSLPSPSPSVSPSPADSANPSVAAGDPTSVRIDLERVVGGLSSPLFATGAGDGSGRLFVVEQPGRIRIVRDGRLAERPFLDIDDRVLAGGERGLLGLAFPPGFGATEDRFWVHYSDENGDTLVSSFRVSADDPDRAARATEELVLHVAQPYANHNGGWIGFGPDGMLYVALGDGGSGGDPEGNGQDTGTMLGKLLRLDVLGAEPGAARAYNVPADNPFAGDVPGRGEIWSYGLRNPWRASFDRLTGDLWIGDVGQGSWEEIDRAQASDGGGRGVNYGWNVTEGRHCFEPRRGCDRDGIDMPITEYDHQLGCTVVGGYVYRGTASPGLSGVYVFGDYCSGLIWGVVSGGPADQEPVLLAESDHTISSFGEDDAGELYVTDLSSGELLRVEAAPTG
jgi:glucose/arabinose dehydrogenase